MILGLQILGVFFACAMIYFALLSYKRGELNGAEIFSWLVVWIFVIFVTVFPELLRTFAQTFFVTRVFDLMVIGGFVVVLSLVTAAYLRTKRTEKKVEEIIRKLALKERKKSKKS